MVLFFYQKPPPAKPETIYELLMRLPKKLRVLIGTVSGIVATVIVHPMDVVKVRMQLNDRNLPATELMRLMIRCEGWPALYAGLTAGVMRQATATSTRLAIYHLLGDDLKRKYNQPVTQALNTSDKVMTGVCAGLVGGIVGNPSEVILVRMMADGPREPCSAGGRRRRYNSVFHAVHKIIVDEGWKTLWRGGYLTMARSIVVSIAHLGTYSEVHALLSDRGILEGVSLHCFASLVASFVTSVLSLPVDVVKSKYQVTSRLSKTQRVIFNRIIETNGILHLWDGMTPYFCRMAAHSMISFSVLQFLTNSYYSYKNEKSF